MHVKRDLLKETLRNDTINRLPVSFYRDIKEELKKLSNLSHLGIDAKYTAIQRYITKRFDYLAQQLIIKEWKVTREGDKVIIAYMPTRSFEIETYILEL
jgi:hypothetical protein